MVERFRPDGGYKKRHIPAGAAYCVYCQGTGCNKCHHKGYYVPDLEEPVMPPPKRQA